MTDKDVGLMQLDLEGNQISGTFPDIEFDCPLCGKLISLKQDTDSVYHRNWTMHFMFDHKPFQKFMLRKYKDEIVLMVSHYMVYESEEWLEKVEEMKQAFAEVS